jgi:hypothetical protein
MASGFFLLIMPLSNVYDLLIDFYESRYIAYGIVRGACPDEYRGRTLVRSVLY